MKAQEKANKLIAKEARAEIARSKRKHNEQWSLKNVKVQGDRLHVAFKENATVHGYGAVYYPRFLQICEENMKLAIERRRRRRQGEDASDLSALQNVRPSMPTETFY